MTKLVTLVALPGLNGTDGLFQPLRNALPPGWALLPISYPVDQQLSYAQLTDYVLQQLAPLDGDFILLGESFSGPLALFVAQAKPAGLRGVILAASFIHAPNLRMAAYLPWALGFRLANPLLRLRTIVTRKANRPLIDLMRRELQKVAPAVLADRIQTIFAVDAAQALIDCAVPIMYLRGTKDMVVPKHNLHSIHRLRPDLKIVEFATPHFLLQAAPREAWAAIIEFAVAIERRSQP